MTGFVVVWQRNGDIIDSHLFHRMKAAIPYRGRDGFISMVQGGIAFGLAFDAMTPEARKAGPKIHRSGTGLTLLGDVRLDNREELGATLGCPVDGGIADEQLVLAALDRWNLAALPRLQGDFSFIIWDAPEHTLTLVRDPSGQRPLFFHDDPDCFIAASDMHQLLCDPRTPIAANRKHILEFLTPYHFFQNEKDHPETFYRDIESVPAGGLVRVSHSSRETRQYWTLTAPREIRYRRIEDYAAQYLHLLSESVRVRLRSSHPVGVLLSGGLDSSSITAVAQQFLSTGSSGALGFHTFSSTFDQLDCDERSFILDLQRLYHFHATFLTSEQIGGRLDPEPVGFRESPNQGVSQARNAMFRAAGEAGVRVLLTGEIADACTLGSQLVFDSLIRQGDVRSLVQYWLAYRRGSTDPLRRAIFLYCLAPLLPLPIHRRLTAWHTRRAIEGNRPFLVPLWMPPSLRRELVDRHREAAVQAEKSRLFSSPARHFESQLLFPPEIARQPAPWPLEIRRPFADRRLQEFLLAIPPELKFSPHPATGSFYAGAKRIVRTAMEGLLPESIRLRTDKTIFSAALTREVADQWPLYERIFGPGGRSEVAEYGLVDPGLFWDRLLALRQGTLGTDLMYVMQMVGLETWLRSLRQPRRELVTGPSIGTEQS
ncbi:MAG: asparagine synthase-related protein [Chloroflexi bacterium]|nr:asparagine synthase-related protein [Chloroflexota bacterium]